MAMQNFDDVVDVPETINLDDSFGDGHGKPKVKFEASTFFNFKNGDNVYRLMPEMFSAKESGFWTVYWARHWGYKNEKGKQQPFVCVRKFEPKTRVVTHECGFCKDQEKNKMALDVADSLVKNLKLEISQNPTPALLAKLEMANGALSDSRRAYSGQERKFWVNAMDQNGNFGILGLPKTVYEQLAGKREMGTRSKGIIAHLEEDQGIKALEVNEGVWFNFKRVGDDQFTTEYSTEVVQESVMGSNGRKQYQAKLAPLSLEQKQTALKKCRDLNTLFAHSVLSDEQISSVVNGSPVTVSAVAAAPKKVRESVDDNFGTQSVVNSGKSLTEDEILALVRGSRAV